MASDIGIAVVTDRDAHHNAMRVTASYLAPTAEVRDQIDWTQDWTRRARGIPVDAALDGAELIAAPTLNQALVRFPDPDERTEDAHHDRRTDAMIAAINEAGTAFFNGTAWKGRRAIRISVINWRTTVDDVQKPIAAGVRVLARDDVRQDQGVSLRERKCRIPAQDGILGKLHQSVCMIASSSPLGSRK